MSGNPPKPERESNPDNIMGLYTLKYRKPIPCQSISKWGEFLHGKHHRKRVRSTYIGDYWVSTVFLGIDHGIDKSKPVLFETMLFKNGDMGGEDCTRATTWREALKQHWAMVNEVKNVSRT